MPQSWDEASLRPVATETRLLISAQHVTPPPPPARVYLPPPPPPAPNMDALIIGMSVFACGAALIGFLLPTWMANYWVCAVLTFVGIAALIFGFGLFVDWSEKFFRSR